MSVPSSTYRLQVTADFSLHAVADMCDYLATLGVGAVYLSPLLPSERGSAHGYDVVAHDSIDLARGGADGWTRALAAARSRGLGVVIDLVPNHVGVADAAQNRAWWSLLREGVESPYASWFDVDWVAGDGKVLIPVLGSADAVADLSVVDGELRYHEHRFPIADGTSGGTPQQVHDRQHYRLVDWHLADTAQNYRRFFSVTTLAGVRVEDRSVFDATHEQVARWAAEGVDGLRIDHPDGLADPAGYLAWLASLAPGTWITVEKILEPGESLPDWPVAGTTGYDALAEVAQVLIDPASGEQLTRIYQELTGDEWDFHRHVAAGKRRAVDTILVAEVARLARLAPSVPDADTALAQLLVDFPVYRSYLPDDAQYLDETLAAARAAQPSLAATLDALEPRLRDPSDELCVRFQQTSGAVMAKGVEDTAYYRYARFAALNEVGADPSTLGSGLAAWHTAQTTRQRAHPLGMTTLSTHDTKRSEDVRARMSVLAEVPDAWRDCVAELMSAAPIDDLPFAYLLWQTFVGAGFIPADRMHAYAQKAMREAATRTTWTEPDEAFESSVHAAIDTVYNGPARDALARLLALIEPAAVSNVLSQKLIQLAMPGIPDVYQGTEWRDDSLVDPDNRRPVDFAARAAELESLDDAGGPGTDETASTIKLWLTTQVLRTRREHPEWFTSYTPLLASGTAADHLVAFDRGGALALATRLPYGLVAAGGWADTTVDVGLSRVDVLTGREHSGPVAVADVLADYPVALLLPA